MIIEVLIIHVFFTHYIGLLLQRMTNNKQSKLQTMVVIHLENHVSNLFRIEHTPPLKIYEMKST